MVNWKVKSCPVYDVLVLIWHSCVFMQCYCMVVVCNNYERKCTSCAPLVRWYEWSFRHVAACRDRAAHYPLLCPGVTDMLQEMLAADQSINRSRCQLTLSLEQIYDKCLRWHR